MLVRPGGGSGTLPSSSKNFRLMLKPFSLPCCHPTGDCCLGDMLELDDWLAAGEWLSGEPLLTPLLALDSVVSFRLTPKLKMESNSDAVSVLRGDDDSAPWKKKNSLLSQRSPLLFVSSFSSVHISHLNSSQTHSENIFHKKLLSLKQKNRIWVRLQSYQKGRRDR